MTETKKMGQTNAALHRTMAANTGDKSGVFVGDCVKFMQEMAGGLS